MAYLAPPPRKDPGGSQYAFHKTRHETQIRHSMPAKWNRRSSFYILSEFRDDPTPSEPPDDISIKEEKHSIDTEISCPRVIQTVSETPYHVFDHSRKMKLVWVISLAGLIAPLSANIYYPAMDAVARVRRRK